MEYTLKLNSLDTLYYGEMAGFSLYCLWRDGVMVTSTKQPLNSQILMQRAIYVENEHPKFKDILEANTYYSEYISNNQDKITEHIIKHLMTMAPQNEDFVNSMCSIVHMSMGNDETLRVLGIYEKIIENTPLPENDMLGVTYAISTIKNNINKSKNGNK